VAKKYVEKDSKKAFEWYKRAADCIEQDSGTNLSHGPDPLACYIIGTTYGSGLEEADVKKDYQSALYYYNRCMTITAPRIDIDFSLLDTQDILPKQHLRSHPPHTRDERYFCSSAFQTGLIYLYGSSPEGEMVHSCTQVDVDPDLAIRYWKEAAMLGHAQACFNIGILYANGMGIDQDLWLAGKWFGRAMKLDTTGSLVVPEGVKIIDWDMTKEQEQKDQQKASASAAATADKKKKKRKVKRTSSKKSSKSNSDNKTDIIGAIVALGSVVAVAGIAWYFYSRGKKSH
jgi:TPR repeat protein